MRPRDLLPWRTFAIDTSWSPPVAALELRKSFDGADAPFVGRAVSETELRFSRVISYRNSFLPVIVAVVRPSHHDGACIRVHMRLHPFVAAFMVIWMTGATLGGLAGVAALLRGHAQGLFALAFPLFGAALVTFPFAFEAGRAERLLRDIFASAPALPRPPDTGEAYR